MEDNNDLFNLEKKIIEEYTEIIDSDELTDNPILDKLNFLLKSYKKMVKQSQKLIKMSDKQQLALKKAKAEIEKLNELSMQLSMSLELETVLNKVLDYLNKSYGIKSCFLSIVNSKNSYYKIEKYVGTSDCFRKTEYKNKLYNLSFPLYNREDKIAECINKNKAFFLNELKHIEYFKLSDESYDNVDYNISNREDPIHFVLLPVSINNEVIGAFILVNPESMILDREDRESISKFAYHISVIVKNSKIFEDVEKSKNKLIVENYKKLQELNKAYLRFVPKEFLYFLDKRSIVEANLGDHIKKDMCVLFVDIRSFTDISEIMTPFEIFTFINEYLNRIGPIIRENNGFIDKYIGDAIMALYPYNPIDALNTAIKLQKELFIYNKELEERGKHNIKIGIGIHYGPVMLGIIGEHQRLEGTVISDTVNVASRLENLTKKYDVSIIISEEILKNIKNIKNIRYRHLDIVYLKGKKNPTTIYEVFEADPEKIKNIKIITFDIFNYGIQFYYEKRFLEACSFFSQVLSINPNDELAKLYLKRAASNMVNGVTESWNGVEILTNK